MQKTFLMWGIVCGRLAAKAFCKGIVSTARRGCRVGSRLRRGGVTAGCKAGTARRRGVLFVRTRRRGLRSMSGHPAYAWGNPPTLRRSSFPQRASRPAGGPIPKHAWGCAPRPPNAQAAAGSALKVPAAHFILDAAGTELKINLISVVASDATFA